MSSTSKARTKGSCPVAEKQLPVDLGDPAVSTGEVLKQIANMPGCFYINPRFLVACSQPTAEFLQRARRAQRRWCQTLGRMLGSSNRRRDAKRSDPIDRMLVHTGLLLVDGVVICPKGWETLTPWIDQSAPQLERTNDEH